MKIKTRRSYKRLKNSKNLKFMKREKVSECYDVYPYVENVEFHDYFRHEPSDTILIRVTDHYYGGDILVMWHSLAEGKRKLHGKLMYCMSFIRRSQNK